MKQLIEKINKLQDGFKFHCYQVTCSQKVTCSQIIGMIQEQESKPFNPVECGFEIDDKERYYKINSGLVIVIEKDEKENSFILQSFVKSHSFDVNNLIKLLEEGECLTYMYFTAPNHRQGVELLRNLGKIE